PLTLLAQPTPPTGSWQATGSLADARAGACAVALNDGDILVAGGSSAAASLASVELYQAEGVFTQGTAMQTGRSGHTCTLLADGRVLITGGQSDSAVLKSTEIFDPSDFSISPGPDMNVARAEHSAVLLDDGRVVVIGGLSSQGETNTAELLDAAASVWTPA